MIRLSAIMYQGFGSWLDTFPLIRILLKILRNMKRIIYGTNSFLNIAFQTAVKES